MDDAIFRRYGNGHAGDIPPRRVTGSCASIWTTRESFVVVLRREERDRSKTGEVWIFRAAYVPIRRHIKVQWDAHPYDPAWESYFAQRSELHPCPLKFERSVFERCCYGSRCFSVPPSPRGSCRFRVSSDRRSERLEPYVGKLSRTVLRGLGGSNPARPLDHGLSFGATPAHQPE